MENLATESFSYSWLTQKPAPPPPSDNLRRNQYDDFHFHVVTSPTHHLVNADEIFSKGQIMAVYGDRSRREGMKTSTSIPASPLSVPFPAADRNNYPHYILGKWRRCSKKILLKCLGLVRQRRRKSSSRVDDLERKVLEVGSFGNSVEASSPRHSSLSAVDNLGYGGFEYCLKINDQTWRNNITTTTTSPSAARSSTSNYDCCDADETSIHEAILYCKRSMHHA